MNPELANLHRRTVIIENEFGLHARPAAKLVQLASTFTCRIQIEREGTVVDGKSIMGVLTLAAGKGTRLILIAQGEDAERALDALAGLVSSKFGER